MTRTHRRFALLIAIIAMVTLLLGACAQPSPEPTGLEPTEKATAAPATAAPAADDSDDDAADDQTADGIVAEEGAVIRFLHIYPEHAGAIEKSIDVIKGMYGFDVEVTVTPWNEVRKTIQTASASGDMYDAFFQWNSDVPGYDQLGLLLDLTPLEQEDPTWGDNFLNAETLNQYRNADGKLMGVPLRGTGVFLIYNKTMFDEYGWQEPSSQEALEALMEQIKADTSGEIYAISAPGKPNGFQMESARARILDHLCYMAGIIESPERLTNRMQDWQGLYAQSAEIMKDWYGKGYFGESPFGLEREEGQTAFFTGKSAMLLCNNNELIALREMNEATGNYELGSFLWPAPEACDQTLFTAAGFGDGWGGWAGSKYPNATMLFLKGFTSKEVMTIWGNEERCVVAASGITYEDNLQQSFAEQFARAGTYRVVSNYNTGNSGDLKGQAFVDYMTGSSMTAQDLEDQIVQITRRAIEDAEE